MYGQNHEYYFVGGLGLIETDEVLTGKLDHLETPPTIEGPFIILAEHQTDQVTVKESLILSLLSIEEALRKYVCSVFTLSIDLSSADEEEIGDYLYELEGYAYQHDLYTYLDPDFLTWTLYTYV